MMLGVKAQSANIRSECRAELQVPCYACPPASPMSVMRARRAFSDSRPCNMACAWAAACVMWELKFLARNQAVEQKARRMMSHWSHVKGMAQRKPTGMKMAREYLQGWQCGQMLLWQSAGVNGMMLSTSVTTPLPSKAAAALHPKMHAVCTTLSRVLKMRKATQKKRGTRNT